MPNISATEALRNLLAVAKAVVDQCSHGSFLGPVQLLGPIADAESVLTPALPIVAEPVPTLESAGTHVNPPLDEPTAADLPQA